MYIVVGAPGEGKSEYVKQFIQGRRCWVFDIQNEYGDRTKYPGQTPIRLPNDFRQLRARYTGDNIEEFQTIAMSKRDTVIVCEEASAFFQGKQNKTTMRMIINRYHTGNHYFFLFHGIAMVPPSIMVMCNYVILYRTLDEHNRVAAKYGRLYPYFAAHQEQKAQKYFIIKMI